MTGAASAPLAVVERCKQVTGRNFYELYGMTEASDIVAIDPVGGSGVPGSVGFALPYTDIEVRHIDTGERCAQGNAGVVIVRGPHVTPGYFDPAHNAGTLVEGGWLDTGDLGYIDATARPQAV